MGEQLNESLMRLAAVPLAERLLTRAQWLQKFSKINLQKIVAVVPDGEAYPLDASWTLVHIGTFWRRDEELHVYAMASAVDAMSAHRDTSPTVQVLLVTPVWVFKRVGNRAESVTEPDVLRIAAQNFMKFFDVLYSKRRTNG